MINAASLIQLIGFLGAVVIANGTTSSVVYAQGTTASSGKATFVTKQPANEWSARVFLGETVQNTAGETLGKIHDFVFDCSGRISTAVIAVGGFMGMGEKEVAVPFNALNVRTGSDNKRLIVVSLSAEAIKQAPHFVASEKTKMDLIKDKASEIGNEAIEKASKLKNEAAEKAGELKDQAAKKLEEMKKDVTK